MTSRGRRPLFDDAIPAAGPAGGDADAQARAFAVDPANNVVLEASAGTGKTSVLVERYLKLIRAGVDPANILAITFTRKAAAEMRERIVRELRAAADRSEADRARWRALRDRLGEIAISTIDAFCLSLLREFPLEADLDPGFSVADETELARLAEEALDRALRISAGLARDDAEVAMVFAQLGVSRARTGLGHLLQRRLVAQAALGRYLASGPRDVTGERACRDVVVRLQRALDAVPGGLQAFLNDGPVDHPRYRLVAADLRTLSALAEADGAVVRAALDRIRDHFLTQTGSPRRSFSRAYHAGLCASPAAWRRHRAAVTAVAPHVADALKAFSRDLNVVLARGVRRMFAVALAEYRRTLDAHAVLDFADLLEFARRLLGQMDEFAQSRYRLESRYHHVLVDEFQDTSRAQWELVSLLVRSWGEGFGLVHDAPLPPTVFVVGDRKQSIYRFRDAEVALLETAGRYIEALRPDAEARRAIARSFRALPDLLAFVNDLFAAIATGDGRADAFRYGESDRFPPPLEIPPGPAGRGPVLGLAPGNDPEACAGVVADEIARILAEDQVRDRQTGVARPASPGDIAILFRSRESHREFERALEERGVAAYVYKGLGFFDADEIKDVLALVRFLAEPESSLKAAAFLRSRFVRLSDPGLAALGPDSSGALLDSAPAALDRLTLDDRRVLELARHALRGWLERVDRAPPADLIEQILVETAYAYELRGPRRQQAWENLKKMRGLIRRIQNRGYATLARIAAHVDRLSAGEEADAVIEALDAVHLMTVHASKGLEFPIVFVVNLGRGTGGPSQPIRIVPDDGSGEPSVSIGRFVSDADEDERRREQEETRRLLYVALTRARDRLYLSSVLKDGDLKPGRGSLAEVLPPSMQALLASAGRGRASTIDWPAPGRAVHTWRICRSTGAKSDRRQATPAPVRDDFAAVAAAGGCRRLPVTSVTRAADGPAPAAKAVEGDEQLVGTLVHRLLQLAAAEIDPARLRRRAVALVAVADAADVPLPSKAIDRAVSICVELTRRPDVAALLASGECLFEVPFSLAVDLEDERPPPGRLHPAGEPAILRGTIDCIVRDRDGRITILEFKTGTRSSEHQAQLDLYVAAARHLFPGAAIEGLLIYA